MHDYTGKLGVVFTKILTPEYLSERMTDREIHETVRIAKKFLSLHSPGCSAFYCVWKWYRIFHFWHYCSYIGIGNISGYLYDIKWNQKNSKKYIFILHEYDTIGCEH